ncbi:MAG TPA: GNAT family N-acetyltransferase [Ignavibacteria bacterium]|nr:GNAT family N-acetyltransferase [Ignavibacteria bacterium]
MDKIKIRKALKSDSKAIINLILELAVFEDLEPPDIPGRKRLLKDAFSKNPPFYVILAEINNEIAGYSFYFFTYSSFVAKKSLYLEDIFISEKHRNKGIGKLFFSELLKIAKKNKCGRMEWVVLDWNVNAIKFYDKLGAKELKEWKTYRLKL